MYLAALKTGLVEALKATFDQDYPQADFRGVHVSMEYPIAEQHYPGVWVDYDDSAQLQVAGIGHKEFTAPGQGGAVRQYSRWRFSGIASFTCVALTSLECARLYDEMVRIMAFGRDNDAPAISEFRASIESNEFIAMNFDFDQIQPRGNSAAPGTPWGTDEIIYERGLDMEVIGEFISDGASQALVPLSAVRFYGKDALDPDDPDQPDVVGATGLHEWQ